MKGWKTILFNIGLAVVGVLQASDLATIISDPQTVGIAMTAIGAVGVVLRFLTNTAVANKG